MVDEPPRGRHHQLHPPPQLTALVPHVRPPHHDGRFKPLGGARECSNLGSIVHGRMKMCRIGRVAANSASGQRTPDIRYDVSTRVESGGSCRVSVQRADWLPLRWEDQMSGGRFRLQCWRTGAVCWKSCSLSYSEVTKESKRTGVKEKSQMHNLRLDGVRRMFQKKITRDRTPLHLQTIMHPRNGLGSSQLRHVKVQKLGSRSLNIRARLNDQPVARPNLP